MQNITPQLSRGAQLIESYGAAGFKIAGRDYTGSVLVSPNATQPISVTNIDVLALDTLLPLLDEMPEVLLFGTGARHEMLSPTLKASLKDHGISNDSMDTGAACRTFNILLAEGRKVAALLILPV